MSPAFVPQTQHWPGTRGVLFVHGIGNASAAGPDAFPLAEFKAAMGTTAPEFAIYTLQYDFINDWAKEKTRLTSVVKTLGSAISARFGGDALAESIAEYAGDVLWPVLSADIRLAIRDAYVAQLEQMHIDSGESALERGDDPLDYTLSIIAHSLGCFHTYEVLTATSSDAQYHLRPRSDLFRLKSVILMASPVKLIRTVGNDIKATVPDIATLATLAQPLAIPSETVGAARTACARSFMSVTGTQDPVGGHLLGAKQSWGYMDLAGQQSVIVPQTLVGVDKNAALAAALSGGGVAGVGGAVTISNPHSWTAYMETEAGVVKAALTT